MAKRNGGQQKRARQWCMKAYRAQGGRCYYCRRHMTIGDVPPIASTCTAEHLKPLADGGANGGTNIVAACLACNNKRSPMVRAHQEKNTLQGVGLINPQKGNPVLYHKLAEAMGEEAVKEVLRRASQEKRSRGRSSS